MAEQPRSDLLKQAEEHLKNVTGYRADFITRRALGEPLEFMLEHFCRTLDPNWKSPKEVVAAEAKLKQAQQAEERKAREIEEKRLAAEKATEEYEEIATGTDLPRYEPQPMAERREPTRSRKG